MKTATPFLTALVLLSAHCLPVVRGSGHVAEDTRSPGEFAAVRVDDVIHASINVGSVASVRVRADDNLLPLVQTDIEGDTIVVRFAPGVSVEPTTSVDVSIEMPALRALDAREMSTVRVDGDALTGLELSSSGASDVIVRGVAGPTLVAHASGGSRLAAFGTARALTLDSSGGAQLVLDGVASDAATLDASGASAVTLRVAGELRGQSTGSSRVRLFGLASTVGFRVDPGSSIEHVQ